MCGAVPTLDPMDIEVPGCESHLVPAQRDEFGRAEPMAKHQQDDRGIARGMPAGFACRLDHGLHFLRSEIVAYGGAREERTVPAVWATLYPQLPIPTVRFWVIFNNQLRPLPQVTAPT